MDTVSWIFYGLIAACLVIYVFYVIIKNAVKNGIIEANYEMEKAKNKKEDIQPKT